MPNGQLPGYAARGATTNPWAKVTPQPAQRPDPCAPPCTPACPACGGLQCLCRPRFFPGQLLTDDDLNRLERYVVDKNRLHNRYLVGWGVACGLEVVCDQCDPTHVVVSTGYALSPCGDDIVVCSAQSVDICALINVCQPQQPACEGPYDTSPARDCRGGNDQWVLAVCYDEKPVRGVTAQLGAGDTTASARCKCGGSSGCGCGGRGTAAATGAVQSGTCSCGGTSTKSANGKTYKPQCEPTQICEGYHFTAYPAPQPTVQVGPVVNPGRAGASSDLLWAWLYANRARFGPLIANVLCCVTRALELRASIRQGKAIDQQFAETTYRQYAAALADFAADFAVHQCAFVTQTVQLRSAAVNWSWNAAEYATNQQRLDALNQRVLELDRTWLEIVSQCLCSALLPSCPAPPATNCVPLAVVTLANNDCRVVEVCNWSQRKLLITWPTIWYWLSWLPWECLREWISGMCCGTERDPQTLQMLMVIMGVVFNRIRGCGTPAAMPAMMAAAPAVQPAGAAPAAPPVGAAAPADPIVSAMGADNLLAYLLGEFDRLQTLGAAATNQPAWAGVAAQLSSGSIPAPATIDPAQLADLTARLTGAEQKLQDQATEIAALKKKVRR